MNIFLLVIMSQPTMYIALDDEGPSELLYAEMTRDWTVSRFMTPKALPLAKTINKEIAELKTLVHIKFERPHFLRYYPSYRFSKYQKWTKFDRVVFVSSTFPYKTVQYLAYDHYAHYFEDLFLKQFYDAEWLHIQRTDHTIKKFLEEHEGYTLFIPHKHYPGFGDVYNTKTRKFEKIKLPTITFVKFENYYEYWSAVKKNNEDIERVKGLFVATHPHYRLTIPKGHLFGDGDVYNLGTRKREWVFFESYPKQRKLSSFKLPYTVK